MIHSVAARAAASSAGAARPSERRTTRLGSGFSYPVLGKSTSVSRVRPTRKPRRVNASGEDGVSLSEAEHDELKALEESGDAFAKLVELAK